MNRLETLVEQARQLARELWERELEPASEADIALTNDWVAERFGQPVPPVVLEFWRLVDGIGGNGISIDGPQGVAFTTGLYVDDYPDYLMLGSYEDIAMYVYSFSAQQFQTLEFFNFDEGAKATYTDFESLLEMAMGIMDDAEWDEW